ncbi:hypothetical protein TPHA_0C01290 [Tetrapisispora phaffii CBS 4417]|uniref:General negative regulator of transcription subunit n=1 Tax=Tetrapisispora phaffii (strain ATCC 24235 / CBS 4417 / NBRC 1672 / NRRL Y-8282 / UCD 70-5) TaxID=1071381 RepID=G8BRA9_TETPH|nr:hypothetical protein TPHA_0C01290 [Tetrapisispora phaffii CBS 4417]CCE62285.1 hypothetical protein TPHA_0C01290 [Tetrapisispora phaffii CBS 4417]
MAHRKLQQEVDKIFKKINEGLEIFDTYYERRENCTNNPSQKEKLESDLKREVKKLQRLREQIKSWQSSPDIKDKDSLLDYRRSVEIAMEKYKAVEKASKEKAYSNNSLKKSDNLDPEELERREVSDYLSQQIDELERQHEILQTEVDKLLLLQKKKKTATTPNAEKKEALKAFQNRYRWHQQQMELALRLLANEELDPQDVIDIKDDINYFVESNQDPDFLEDESIYDNLNLQSNEAIAHEVAQSFAAQRADERDTEEDSFSKDAGGISKKDQRKLEREARKAAREAAKEPSTSTQSGEESEQSSSVRNGNDNVVTIERVPSNAKSNSTSPSPSLDNFNSPELSPANITAPSTAKSSGTPKLPYLKTTPLAATKPNTPASDGQRHQHIQIHNGVTTTTTLKPATIPIRPAGELKWAAAASQAMEKTKKPSLPSLSPVPTTPTQATSKLGQTLKPNSSTPVLSNNIFNQPVKKTGMVSSLINTSDTAINQLSEPSDDVVVDNSDLKQLDNQNQSTLSKNGYFIYDDYVSDVSDDEISVDKQFKLPSTQTLIERENKINEIKTKYAQHYELITLPNGIQQYILGRILHDNNLNVLNGKLGGYRKSLDTISIPRLDSVPIGVNPPTPLDAFKSTHQWDMVRTSLSGSLSSEGSVLLMDSILEKFRNLDSFTLFYNFYFSVTSMERDIAAKILVERNWIQLSNGVMWFLRQGNIKFANENSEVADYKIFKADDWTVVEKLNFKLDYDSIMDPVPKTVLNESVNSENNNDADSLSHGKQLLQQLNRGKIAT